MILSVAYSPNGSQILSGGSDATLKVWDAANPRPYLESEWEEVKGDGEELLPIYMDFPYWKNSITGDVQQDKPSGAGEGMMNRDQKHGTINAWDSGGHRESDDEIFIRLPD